MDETQVQFYTCFECAIQGRAPRVKLDKDGRCEICHSDAVLTDNQVNTIRAAGVVPVAPSIAPTIEYYWLKNGEFETCVTHCASDGAAIVASHELEHPWYHHQSYWSQTTTVKKITRDEYCDWLRKRKEP